MKISTKSVQVKKDNIDFYWHELAEESQNWVTKTGFVITPNNISFNLTEKYKGLGLSFISGYIFLENALDFYSTLGKVEKEEAQRIKNNKKFEVIKRTYTYKITRDNSYRVDKNSVSCEYFDLTGVGESDKDTASVASKICKIINKIKDIICDSLYQKATEIKKEVKDMEKVIVIKYIEKDYYPYLNEDGEKEYIASGYDEASNYYEIKGLVNDSFDVATDDRDTPCNHSTPQIRYIKSSIA